LLCITQYTFSLCLISSVFYDDEEDEKSVLKGIK
jgi:hypothetical protein